MKPYGGNTMVTIVYLHHIHEGRCKPLQGYQFGTLPSPLISVVIFVTYDNKETFVKLITINVLLL